MTSTQMPSILKGLRDYETFTASLAGTALLKSKKVFDNSKVTDHHAIIPTGQHPQNLTDMERRVFDLIARRFIAVFYPDCKFATTTVLGEVESIEFKVTGKQILEPGWRVIFGTPSAQSQEEKEEKGEEENVLPAFVKGEAGRTFPIYMRSGRSRPGLIRKPPCCVLWKRRASWWITTNCVMR